MSDTLVIKDEKHPGMVKQSVKFGPTFTGSSVALMRANLEGETFADSICLTRDSAVEIIDWLTKAVEEWDAKEALREAARKDDRDLLLSEVASAIYWADFGNVDKVLADHGFKLVDL